MGKLAAAIQGIGDAFEEKLTEAGIGSLNDLLEKGAEKASRSQLAEMTGIAEKKILGWVNRADLSRVKGIGAQYADLLEAAGVDTVKELAQRNAENLHAKMKEINDAKGLVRRLPLATQVSEWVAQAKDLPRKVNY